MHDLLIVGGGPTGLSLAVQAARHGASVRLVEKGPAISPYSRAVIVQARTMEVLEDFGVLEEMRSFGEPARHVSIFADEKRVCRLVLDGLDAPHRFPLIASQHYTEQVLEERARALGVRIDRASTLVDLVQVPGGVVSRVRRDDGSEEEIRTRWLAGCDGAHSSVRKALDLPFEGLKYDESFIVADVRLEGELTREEFFIFFTKFGFCGAWPMHGDHRWRIIVGHHDQPPSSEVTLEELQRRVSERLHFKLSLSDVAWMTRYSVSCRITPTYQKGNVFLAGDAAHIHAPTGGQGMNVGIQDAYNLGWKLGMVQSGQAPESLLDSYTLERRPIGLMVQKGTDRAFRTLMTANPRLGIIRRHLLPAAFERERVLYWFREAIAGLRFHYKKSPIVGASDRGQSKRHPAPGMRAPDARLETVAGEATRLHELLLDTRHHLFIFLGEGSSAADAARCQEIAQAYDDIVSVHWIAHRGSSLAQAGLRFDPDGSAHRRYAMHDGGVVLVRPDCYVAFRGALSAHAQLRRFLEQHFIAAKAAPARSAGGGRPDAAGLEP